MNMDDAELVLRKAITFFVNAYPEQKNEVEEALDTLFEITRKASSIAAECQQLLDECLQLMQNFPFSTLKTS
ncbi:hypothetical protein BIU88_09450 [Chlorobaculum limnaeum]|uniref:Uncharacterized protein n=1 Tax=Chlorobaculum limnaeum TaxID=274537 RepID=A0A1D8D2B8_CHLLM|nr:hypothetical protein [Chlorobaculum limnaeum]AOS84333.1 hypothetical protein BIU88_09450 [Chlorobaculum limnaeum]